VAYVSLHQDEKHKQQDLTNFSISGYKIIETIPLHNGTYKCNHKL